MPGILVGFAGGYSKTTGRWVGFNWKDGLTIFVVFAILTLLVFVASRGIRYFVRRFRPPS